MSVTGGSMPTPQGASKAEDLRGYFRHLRHELRTPMNAIMGYAEMLLEEAQGEAQQALREILETSGSILNLIDRFAELSANDLNDANLIARKMALQHLTDAQMQICVLTRALKFKSLFAGDKADDLEEICIANETLGGLLQSARAQLHQS